MKYRENIRPLFQTLALGLYRVICQWGKTFYFLFLEQKSRNRAMLLNETLIELLDTDIGRFVKALSVLFCQNHLF